VAAFCACVADETETGMPASEPVTHNGEEPAETEAATVKNNNNTYCHF
jgi:hypothetical protein